jgi:hypothetical protein
VAGAFADMTALVPFGSESLAPAALAPLAGLLDAAAAGEAGAVARLMAELDGT